MMGRINLELSPLSHQHKIRELEQEMVIKNEIINLLDKQDENKILEPYTNHAKNELEQENHMFKELLESMESKESSEKNNIFSLISHELKTPLVPVQGYVKMLKEEHFGQLDEIQKEKLGIIDSNTTALSNLIQNILDFQKLSTGSMKMNKKQNNFRNIIDNVFSTFDLELEQKGIKKIISVDKNIKINCDAKRISQVLSNLIKNSIDALPSNLGEISVKATQLKKTIKVSVYDNGYGIPKEETDKIFTKFHQVDMSTTREKSGLGLGLAISKKIIDAHNGEMWCESSLGKGTTMNFTLPKNIF